MSRDAAVLLIVAVIPAVGGVWTVARTSQFESSRSAIGFGLVGASIGLLFACLWLVWTNPPMRVSVGEIANVNDTAVCIREGRDLPSDWTWCSAYSTAVHPGLLVEGQIVRIGWIEARPIRGLESSRVVISISPVAE